MIAFQLDEHGQVWELSSFSEAAKAVVLLADILRLNHRLREQARSHS